jgi:hypothetical protein
MLTLDKLAYRLAGATVGFVIGCLALLILFFIIQIVMEIFGVSRVRFRAPIAIVVLPFMAAFFGFRLGPDLFVRVQTMLGYTEPWTRFLLVGPVFWAGVVLAYVFIFNPFGYYISDDEWLLVAKIILFPTGVLWSGAWVFKKFVFRK